MNTTVEPLNEEQLASRAIVVVRRGEELDAMESRILEARLGGDAQETAEAYLYVLPAHSGNKPIVGASVDFVRQAVRWINAGGQAQLSVSDQPPVVQEVMIQGRAHVRVLACALDRLTGEVKWGLKEEAREALDRHGKVYHNAHAATIALEKAERKALESHPSYNRKMVNTLIKKFLKKAGVDPAQFQIGGRGGAWSDFFGRAKKAGVAPAAIRAAVADRTGKGLSETTTAADALAAAAAVDAAIPDAAADSAQIREHRGRALEIIQHIGLTPERQKALWEQVGSPARVLADYKRLRVAVDLMAVGETEVAALAAAHKLHPKTVPTEEGT